MRNCCAAPYFLHKDDSFIGIHLPADFTAEHEWGIEDLANAFGIEKVEKTKPPFGIERYKATIVPNMLMQRKGNKTALAYVDKPWMDINLFKYSDLEGRLYDQKHSENTGYEKYEIQARGAWDGDSFGVVAEGDKADVLLTMLHEAIKEKDLAIFLGGGGTFLSNSGLNIAIASKIPDDAKELIKTTHEETASLHKAAEATGIYKKIPKSMYYALSPSWDKDKKLVFWLNPTDQPNNNFGYYNVKELEQWLVGKGPILKKNKVKKNGS